MMNFDNGVHLAVRGGGVKSAAAIGVLKALEELGIAIKSTSGASLGSIVSILVANGFNSKEILELFLAYNKVLTKGAILLGGKGSSVIEESVNKEIGNKTFQELSIPCMINASYGTEWNPKLFLFSKETTPDITGGVACRASASLQLIYFYYFKKIRCIDNDNVIEKRYKFFDGGYSANPYIPMTNIPVVYSTFCTIKKNKLKKNWQKTPLVAENLSDIVIKPYLGKIGVVGSCDDMKMAHDLAYEESKKVLTKILR